MERAETIRDSVLRDGYAFIQSIHTEHGAQDAFELIGKIDTLEGFSSVQTLTPKSEAHATPNTYSGNYGLGVFPFHTDLAHWFIPPRFIALRCEVGAPSVTTRILDGKAQIIDSLGEDLLYHSLVIPRRPTRYGVQLLRILDKADEEGAFLLRWDSLYLRAANKAAIEARNRIMQILKRTIPFEVELKSRGDTLIIDNWRMLHGRSLIGTDALLRDIRRTYMSNLP